LILVPVEGRPGLACGIIGLVFADPIVRGESDALTENAICNGLVFVF
jgi:hypothetical protein